MSFRSIAFAAITGVVLVALLQTFVVPALTNEALFWYTVVARTGMLAMVALAAAFAAHKFGWWGEYVGRAWTLFFIEYAVLTASEVLRRALPDASLARSIAVVVANLAGIGAYVLMARSLSAAGLEFYGSRTKKVLAITLALAVAVALCYGPIVAAFEALGSDGSNVGSLVSPVADVITFVLVAPLLLTVIALRGGQVFWMFALLTAGTVGWMVNQGAATLLSMIGSSENAIRTGRMTGFAMACFLIAAAALTQWLAANRAMKGAAHA
ncbi:MAG: hypothetical protein ACXW5U_32445 [Thermoanaerobaculia bacterium]